jgi:hypothetical protein
MPIHMSFEDLPAPYDRAEPDPAVLVAEAPAVPTLVVRAEDVPTYRIPALCREVLTRLGAVLDPAGVEVAGPAFVLHRRHPVDTADVEIGLPVTAAPAAPLALRVPAPEASADPRAEEMHAEEIADGVAQVATAGEAAAAAADRRSGAAGPAGFGDLTAIASELPAGRVAVASYIGPRSALADAWGEFTQDCGERREQMTYPFWELFGPVDGDRTRTDLVSLLEPRKG